MVPDNTNNIAILVETDYPSRTYRLDPQNKRIAGFIDELDAVIQAIYKSVSTERYSKLIYEDYGTETEALIGQDADYVKSTIQDKISESLLSDNRITSLTNFVIESSAKDELTVTFTANTIFGTKQIGPIGI